MKIGDRAVAKPQGVATSCRAQLYPSEPSIWFLISFYRVMVCPFPFVWSMLMCFFLFLLFLLFFLHLFFVIRHVTFYILFSRSLFSISFQERSFFRSGNYFLELGCILVECLEAAPFCLFLSTEWLWFGLLRVYFLSTACTIQYLGWAYAYIRGNPGVSYWWILDLGELSNGHLGGCTE